MPQGAVNPLLTMNFLPFIIIIVLFYFMILRPQRQQEKERQKMLQALAKNDEVVTASGIHGTIVNVKEKTLILRIDDNVKIEIERSAIAERKKSQGAAA